MIDKLLELELESLKIGLLSSERFWQKPLIIFNSASKCLYTKQLTEFQKIYQEGRVVPIAIPTNNFGEQEPGDDYEIYQFYNYNYDITFPIIKKTTIESKFFKNFGIPTWNFNKYIFNSKHEFIRKFESQTSPRDCLEYV